MAERIKPSNRRAGAPGVPRADKPKDDVREAIDSAVENAFLNEEAKSGLEPEVAPIAQQTAETIGTDPVGGSLTEVEPPAPPTIPEVFQKPAIEKPPLAPFTDPLPARMLNEYVYCPRLFYYEHVEGVFVHNADTQRGASIHKRVDSGSGAMPLPSSDKADGAAGSAAGQVSTEAPEAAREGASASQETIHSKSVSLGSERLGVTAKIDLVETRPAAVIARDGEPDLFARPEVCPVDYKVGAPRQGDDGTEIWDADKMQLGLQCLLLRENGYLCNEGIIYYRATKQRVRLPVTPELEQWVLERIEGARRCSAGPIPPPLFDSPKCPRCSLVTVCLPDETRMLAARAAEGDGLAAGRAGARTPGGELRRLIAPRDETRALYLTTPGLYVGRSGEVLQVKEGRPSGKRGKPVADGDANGAAAAEKVEEFRIGDLAHVALFGNVQASTAVVQALCEADVPLTYFSMGGWFYGLTRGHSLKNVFTRVEQFRLARDPQFSLRLARRFVEGKIHNHRVMLMRNHLEAPAPILAKLKNSAETALAAGSIEQLLGVEGAAAAFYFQQFNGMIKVEDELSGSPLATTDPQLRFNFDFSGRKRRPPTDPVNALLSLAYSLLAKDCTIAAYAVGCDPYLGFYHQPRFGRPALALDLMEEFRPLIAESAVLTAINNRMITEKDFVRAGRAVNLSAAGRKQFFVTYEKRMNHLVTHPIFDYQVTYRRAIELQFRILARVLTGEIAEYEPFKRR